MRTEPEVRKALLRVDDAIRGEEQAQKHYQDAGDRAGVLATNLILRQHRAYRRALEFVLSPTP